MIMKMHSVIKLGFLASLLVFSTQSFSQTEEPKNETSTAATAKLVAKTPEEDAMVTRSIEQLIKGSPLLSKLKVEVSTHQGVVVLAGNVDFDGEASGLIELAESVIGVADVDASKLVIKKSEKPIEDTIITAKIKGLLIREDLLGEKDVASINTSVETTDGVVLLTGLVDNKEQIDNAILIIKKFVPEVKSVKYSVRKVN